jgi:predicted PurR-regulated permease PerM
MPVDLKGRILTIVVLAIALITIWFMLDIAIVTFILTFVFYHLQKYALFGLAKTPFRILPPGIVLLLIYIGVIFLFVLFVQANAPMIMKQLGDIALAFVKFDMQKFLLDIDPNLLWLADKIDINTYIVQVGQAILNGLTSFGAVALNFLIALVLSFLFVLERKKIAAIGDTVKGSRVAVIYRYFLLFAGSFCYTFGKVMKVQIVIAAINCAISTVYLSIAGFPYIMVLAIMIFILGLIPVAGVFISLVPLTIIAFNVGGLEKVIEVLIMIAVIHAIEAYFLNPKLMSRRTSLPVSMVFVVLIISEKYLGAWGMLIGVPVFIYILNVLNIDYRRAMEAEFFDEDGKEIEKKPKSGGKKLKINLIESFQGLLNKKKEKKE